MERETDKEDVADLKHKMQVAINLLVFGLGVLTGLVIALFMLPRGCP